MPYCQNLIQSLANWEKALKEFEGAKNQYLEKFSEKEREILNEKRAKLQEAKEEYFKLKKESYVEIEIEKGRKEKLFGPEYEALERLYQGCGLRLLEKGRIFIEKGRLVELQLVGLSSKTPSPQIIQQRTQAFKGIRRFLELKVLYCPFNQLSELDVSQNKKLERLYCSSNQLSELDVSQNRKLIHLLCEKNFLSQENCQEIEAMKKGGLSLLYPQYPKEILDFLKNLQQREPGLNKEEARIRIREYLQSPEIQSKLVPRRIELPDEENLTRILTYFFKS